MRTSQKVALTILISLLITGGFAALAYTGLFRVLETGFFSERVKSDQLIRLELAAGAVSSWNDDNISRFDALARDRNFQSVFSVTQREEEITYRAQVSDSLEDKLIGYRGLRIVDNDGRLQYSTFAGDISSEQLGEDGRRLYRNWSQLEDTFELSVAGDLSNFITIHDGENQQTIYLLPIQDSGFVTRGWMIVYISSEGLADRLLGEGLAGSGGRVYIVDGRGVIIDIRPEQVEAVRIDIDSLWPIDSEPEEFALLAQDFSEKYWLAGTIADDNTWVGKLIPGRLLGFTTGIQILILATVFISSALLLFLLLNLRQDPTEILRGRIKKLQVSLLRDWLEHHEDRKLRLSDLESRRNDVRNELMAGLGKLRTKKAKETEKIIDDGWTRIIEILAEKDIERGSGDASDSGAGSEAQPPIDMKQLEDMITRAVSDVKIVPHVQMAPDAPAPGRPINVEVLSDDDLEELDELDEVDDVESLEDLEELVEEPGNYTGLGKPIDVEELSDDDEVEDLADLGEPIDVEELSDDDEVEDLADLGEPIDVEVLSDDDEVEDLADLGEPIDVEELSDDDEVEDLADLGEPMDVEELSDTDEPLIFEDLAVAGEFTEFEDESDVELLEVEELDGVTSEISAPEVQSPGILSESDSVEILDDNIEELEMVEELETTGDIEDEEVLEVLPVVLTDDSRELIEIDKVDQDRLYMFEKEFNKSDGVREDLEDTAELEEINEQVEDFDEMEELEELVEIPTEPVEKIVTGADGSARFISIEDIMESIKTAESKNVVEIGTGAERGESMEYLVRTRTTGILPGMDLMDSDFRFDDDTPELNWSDDGLDYDRFLKGFKKGATGIYKSLMSLSKDYNAICGVLLSGSRKGLETDYAVGLDDESATHLSVTRNEAVWSDWFSERKVVFVPNLPGSLYAEKTSHNEFRFIQSALFLPAVYHGSQSYIFLGFKEPPVDPLAMLVKVQTMK